MNNNYLVLSMLNAVILALAMGLILLNPGVSEQLMFPLGTLALANTACCWSAVMGQLPRVRHL